VMNTLDYNSAFLNTAVVSFIVHSLVAT
jgi:hypothetical protein